MLFVDIRFLSTVISRYLTFWARLIDSPFIFTSSGPIIQLVCRLLQTVIYSVLSVFKLSIFCCNYSAILATSAFRSLQSSSISLAEQETLMSLAYMLDVHFLRHCSKSLT